MREKEERALQHQLVTALVVLLGWFCCMYEEVHAIQGVTTMRVQQHRPGLSLGGSACVANAELTYARNAQQPALPLDATAQAYLRPWFGNLVDKVRVVWNARLNDSLEIGRQVLARGSRAQTYGYQVFVSPSQGARDPGSTGQLLLLAHELVHVAQYVRYRESLERFCHEYVQGWARHGGVYNQNPLEQEAFEAAFEVAQWLGQQVRSASKADTMAYVHEGDRLPARKTLLPRRVPVIDASHQQATQQRSGRPGHRWPGG